jgi:hypothetical protein
MGNGFYLYCIRLKTNETIEVRETISGDGNIKIIPYHYLEAIVSEVSLAEFGSDEIQKKAGEDLEWIKVKAQIHEEVIEQAMGKNNSKNIPVIPMQFGVIFKTIEKLQETLSYNVENFRKSLEYLTGKQEFGVKIFLNQKIFEEFLENSNGLLLAKKKEAESMPKGMAFFAKKQAASLIDEIKGKELDKITGEMNESLFQLAANFIKAKNLEKDFTGIEEKMILNNFYLIEEPKLKNFQKKVEELKGKFNPTGIKVNMSGPWPSYHFA